jgi:predicted amino acid-binding ACT domain protein
MAITISGSGRIGIVTTEGAAVASGELTVAQVSELAVLEALSLEASLDTEETSIAYAAFYERAAPFFYEMELLYGYDTSWYNMPQNFHFQFPKVDLGSDQNLYGNLKDDLNNRTVEGLNFYSSNYPANSSYDKSFGAMYPDWNLGLGPEALYASDGTLFDLDTIEIYASDGSLNNLEIIESIAPLIYTSNATITSIKAEFGSDPFWPVAVTPVTQNGVSLAYIAAVEPAPDIFFVSYTYSYPSSEIKPYWRTCRFKPE